MLVLEAFSLKRTGIMKDTHSGIFRWARRQVFEEKEGKKTVSFAFSP